MNFEEARSWLTSSLAFGIQMGLHRMNRLMDLLGHPEKDLHCIHIAGTNGKGSVSSYCAAILAAAGHRTGVFTSPYLERLTERIRVIEGLPGLQQLQADETAGEIEPDAFAEALSQIHPAVSRMLAEGYEHPTEFEILTAAGFLYFADQNCDVVVLETGLGGRLDSTNIISQPLACLITALGFDHMDRLGDTMAEIAAEKAGIIKSGSPVFLYNPHDLELTAEQADDAEQAIRHRCLETGSPLCKISQIEIEKIAYSWDGQTFSDRKTGLMLQTSLLGLFQPMNAAMAARVCLSLGLADAKAVSLGLSVARWPARLEVLRREPPVLLDGAHNLQGCQALAAALSKLLPGQPVIFLTGMLQDKDYHAMLRAVLDQPGYRPAAVFCVKPDSPRALQATELATAAAKVMTQLHIPLNSGYNVLDAIHAIDSPGEGARQAFQLATKTGTALCAFGSLYMAGSIRGILRDREDRFWTGKG